MSAPPLHHLRARSQIQRMVISRTDGISRRVRKLQLDVSMIESLLMQNGRREPPEPMSGHSLLETHDLQSLQNRVVADGPPLTIRASKPITREQEFIATSETVQQMENLQGLGG